jgi:hypothetical protein
MLSALNRAHLGGDDRFILHLGDSTSAGKCEGLLPHESPAGEFMGFFLLLRGCALKAVGVGQPNAAVAERREVGMRDSGVARRNQAAERSLRAAVALPEGHPATHPAMPVHAPKFRGLIGAWSEAKKIGLMHDHKHPALLGHHKMGTALAIQILHAVGHSAPESPLQA